MHNVDDLLNNRWVRESADVAKLVLLTGKNLSENTSHDLAAAGLGKIWDNKHGLGRREGANTPADLEDEVLAEGIIDFGAVLDGHKGVDSLAGELVGNPNDGRLGNGGVLNEGGLDLSRAETVTADVDNVINTATDPVEALVIATGTIARELHHLLA